LPVRLSPEAEKSQYRENDDDCSDPPNDVVHGVLLAANGKCGRVVSSGTWTITTFKEEDRNSQQDDVGVGTSSSQSNTGQDVTCDAALNDAIPWAFQLAGGGIAPIRRCPSIVTSPFEPLCI